MFRTLEWGKPPKYKPEVTFYEDRDRDGFGVEEHSYVGTDRPEGFADFVGDCEDNDSDVFPGQGQWFLHASAAGNYDYDCDGKETAQFSISGSCRGGCGAANEGWLSQIPACGKSSLWLNDCDYKPFRGGCVRETQTRWQACR